MNNTSHTYKDLTKIIRNLEEERKRILSRLNEINKEISAVETTKRLISGKSNGKGIVIKHEGLINDLKNRRNELSQLKAIIEIANKIEDKNKTFRVNEVKNIMAEAGFFENPKNASATVYTIMDRSGNFERVEAGIYKLKKNDTIIDGKQVKFDTIATWTIGDGENKR